MTTMTTLSLAGTVGSGPPLPRKRKADDGPAGGGSGHASAPPGPGTTPGTTPGAAPGVRRFRASRACQYCRTRKVRCDVLLRADAGCTNCRLDGRECVLLASRRGRAECWLGCEGGPGATVVERAARVETKPVAIDVPDPDPDVPVPVPDPVPDPDVSDVPGDVPVCVTFHGEHEEALGRKTASSLSAGTPVAAVSLDALSLSPAGSASSTTAAHPSGSSPGSTAAAALPGFIAPFRNRIPAEDLEFLALKGALTVPAADVRLAILKGYVFSVYPFMPMLELEAFVAAVAGGGEEGGQVSLLLFQAVMFAGLSSLEPVVLRRLGFATAKAARAVFFTRVKLLYEFDIEPDGAAVFQALLLMSSWFSTWSEWRDTSYWTAQAALVAQNLGLHRQPTAACGPPRVQALRRRMWWSLLIRDRMLALGTRRPMRVRDDDYDVSALTLGDFTWSPPLARLVGFAVDQQQATARLCVDLAQLCVVAGHVLATQYTTLSTTPPAAHTTMVVPRRSGQRPHELQRLDGEIDAWVRQRAVPCPGSGTWSDITSFSSPTASLSAASCADVHAAMLSMTHLTLVNVLHRTQALQPLAQAPEARALRAASRRKVKDAACRVTALTHTLLRRGLVRFLGLNGITALLAACLSHLVDVRTGHDDDVRDASLFRFDQSMHVLQAMRGMYATADAAVAFLAAVVRKVSLRAPSLASSLQAAAPDPWPAAPAAPDWTQYADAADGGGSFRAQPLLPLVEAPPPPAYDEALLPVPRLPLPDADRARPFRLDDLVLDSVVAEAEPPMDFEPILYNYEFFMDNLELGETG